MQAVCSFRASREALLKQDKSLLHNNGFPRALCPARGNTGARPPSGRKPSIPGRSAAVAGRQGAVPPAAAGKTWEATISSNSVLDEDDYAGSNLQIVVIYQDSGERSKPFDVNTIPWEKKAKKALDGLYKGWSRKGRISLSGVPGAVLVSKFETNGTAPGATQDYISTITLSSDGEKITIPVNSFITPSDGERIFFASTAFLPKDTPKTLVAARAKELEVLRGNGGPQKASDRVYDYQLWDTFSTATGPRLTLGGNAKLPYPRMLRGLPSESGPNIPWVPLSDQFGFDKQQQLAGDGIMGQVNAFAAVLAQKLELREDFENFGDTFELYTKSAGWDTKIGEDMGAWKHVSLGSADAGPGKLDVASTVVKKALAGMKEKLSNGSFSAKFNEPRIIIGRQDVWGTDEEYGRLFLAGIDPCSIFSMKFMPEKIGSAIRSEHVDAEIKALGGSSLAELVAQAAAGGKPRLFMVDYFSMSAFWEVDKEDLPGRAEHAGRAIFFLQQDDKGHDKALIPLVFELKHKGTAQEEAAAGRPLGPNAGVIYTRKDLAHDPKKKVLWLLAKAVFRSLEGVHHQLISHWLRCHAVIEPFIIAMHRQISALHPVYKLMMPHFRYTLAINNNGRTSVFKADNFVESAYTAGKWTSPLSALVYGRTWRFHQQSPPGDLRRRGMLDKDGKPWTDYPYASDSLDIYAAIKEYFNAYLKLYYKSDADVLADPELQAWWDEVKNVGHQDLKLFETDEAKIWGFAGPIATVDELTEVLSTIAWITSGHHAAVNFGMYDHLAPVLVESGLTRRRIPSPHDTSNPAYHALVEAPSDKSGRHLQEKEFLSYLASSQQQLLMMVVMKGFAAHAPDEHYLDEPNELLAPEAKALNQKFIKNVKALEATFAARNKDPANWTRGRSLKESTPYTLLMPSSGPGVTSRGIPYSVSI